ncbi:MAG: hypothetical protein VX899_22885 [Myxococcota bacterium]|nr:hypothetical protein [Myxococcota bacterium]
MTARRLLALAPLALLALVACQDVDCMEAPAVEVQVLDPDGEPMDAVVEYSRPDIDPDGWEACEEDGDTLGAYICGREHTGSYAVRASADGYVTQEQEVEVALDEEYRGQCMPITESVELQLEAE